MADVATTAIEAALYNKFENYIPGAAFTTNDIVQVLVNYDIYNRMGLNYSKQQEKEADNTAIQFMQFMKKIRLHWSQLRTKFSSITTR